MKTRLIFEKGNSLAVVIPAEIVKELNLKKGDTVAWVKNGIVKIMEVENGKT